MAQLKSDGFRKSTIRYNPLRYIKTRDTLVMGTASRNSLIMALTSTKNIVCIVTYRIQTCIVCTWNELRVRIHVVVYNQASPTQWENNSLLLLSFRPMFEHSRIKHKNSSKRNQMPIYEFPILVIKIYIYFSVYLDFYLFSFWK